MNSASSEILFGALLVLLILGVGRMLNKQARKTDYEKLRNPGMQNFLTALLFVVGSVIGTYSQASKLSSSTVVHWTDWVFLASTVAVGLFGVAIFLIMYRNRPASN